MDVLFDNKNVACSVNVRQRERLIFVAFPSPFLVLFFAHKAANHIRTHVSREMNVRILGNVASKQLLSFAGKATVMGAIR